MSDHDGQVIWVTGGASGIGRATAEAVVAGGGRVVASDLDRADFSWADGNPSVTTMTGDATSEADNAAAVALAIETFGRIDGACFSAGMPMRGDLVNLPLEQFDAVMELNVRGVLLGIRAAVPHLPAGGAMVAIASTSGTAGDPGMWPYNTSKAAVINLVRATALDLGPRGIRINTVCPGPTETGMTTRFQAPDARAAYDDMAGRTALQRWGRAEEQGAAVSFLLSQQASFITGTTLVVDGGLTAGTGQFTPGVR